jgi:hypothetical protein
MYPEATQLTLCQCGWFAGSSCGSQGNGSSKSGGADQFEDLGLHVARLSKRLWS